MMGGSRGVRAFAFDTAVTVSEASFGGERARKFLIYHVFLIVIKLKSQTANLEIHVKQ